MIIMFPSPSGDSYFLMVQKRDSFEKVLGCFRPLAGNLIS